MKTRQIIIVVLSLLSMSINAQSVEPLIIEGQITNSSEPWLFLIVQSESGQPELDTISLDQNGHFYHNTHKVTFPQRSSLRNKDIQLNDFFIAPGYHLRITGDGTDFPTLLKTAK